MKTFKEYFTEATRETWPEIVWTTEKFRSGLVEDYVFKNVSHEMKSDIYRIRYLRADDGTFEPFKGGGSFKLMELKREASSPMKDIEVRVFDTEDEFMGELTLAEL